MSVVHVSSIIQDAGGIWKTETKGESVSSPWKVCACPLGPEPPLLGEAASLYAKLQSLFRTVTWRINTSQPFQTVVNDEKRTL